MKSNPRTWDTLSAWCGSYTCKWIKQLTNIVWTQKTQDFQIETIHKQKPTRIRNKKKLYKQHQTAAAPLLSIKASEEPKRRNPSRKVPGPRIEKTPTAKHAVLFVFRLNQFNIIRGYTFWGWYILVYDTRRLTSHGNRRSTSAHQKSEALSLLGLSFRTAKELRRTDLVL